MGHVDYLRKFMRRTGEPIRLGFGEYEQTDVPVLDSVVFARIAFFTSAWIRKAHYRETLLRFAVPESFPRPLSRDKRRQLFSYFTSYLKGDKGNVGIPEHCFDTPLTHYALLQFDRHAQPDKLKMPLDPVYSHYEKLESFARDLESLTQFESGRRLRESLIKWGSEENLGEEWCYEYALRVLKDYCRGWLEPGSRSIRRPIRYDSKMVDSDGSQSVCFGVCLELEYARPSLQAEELLNSGFERSFSFKYKHIDVWGHWMPELMPKAHFIAQMENTFMTQFLEDVSYHHVPEIWSRYDTDGPPEVDPDEIGVAEAIKILEAFRDSLAAYINSCEGKFLKRARRTRVKKNPEHFDWFVDYQLHPCMEVYQIARRDGVHPTSVSEAIDRVGTLIGLKPRKAPRGQFRKK